MSGESTKSKALPPSVAGARLRRRLPGWVLAAALGVLAFLPSLRYPLLFDDAVLALNDTRVHPPINWAALVTTPLWQGAFPPPPAWRPAVLVSFAANRLLLGQAPWGFRLVNLLLHGLVAGLVWVLVCRIGAGQRVAGTAAVVFALHPVHTEAVVGIVGRAELMMTAGTLLTILWGLKALGTGGRGRLGWLLAAAAAYAFALFSKEQGFLALPLLAMVWLTARAATPSTQPSEVESDQPGEKRRDSRGTGPTRREAWRNVLLVGGLLCAVALAGLSLRTRLFGWHLGFDEATVQPIDNPLVEVTDPGDRVATAVRLFGRAVALMVLPLRLSPDYSSPGVPIGWEPLGLTLLSGMTLLLLVVLVPVLWFRGRGSPARVLAAFGLAWFLLTELPVSNLFVLNGTIFGERMLYLPSIGACLLLALGVEKGTAWISRRTKGEEIETDRDRIASGDSDRDSDTDAESEGGAGVGGSGVPRDGAPGSPVEGQVQHANYGRRPDLQRLAVFIGVAGLLLWCWSSARPWRSESALFRQAIHVVPRSAKARYGLALALKQEGDLEGARRELVIAVGLWPRYSLAWHELGLLALADHDPGQAERYLRHALALRPRQAESHNSLGNALATQGRYREALREFERYRALGPLDPQALQRKIENTRRMMNQEEKKANGSE